MKPKILAIIPARGGSKRIPRKNIKPFFGQPIIKYTIDSLLKCKFFDEIMVSTDDREIANIAIKYGAKVPFLRSKVTSNDNASLEDVSLEVLDKYVKSNRKFDYLTVALATAPFIKEEDIKNALYILKDGDVSSVFSITNYPYPIQRALRINNGLLEMFWPENIDKRSQDLEPAFHDAGQFYCVRVKNFIAEKQFFSKRSKAIVIPEFRVQDIDTVNDWENAEIKYTLINNIKGK